MTARRRFAAVALVAGPALLAAIVAGILALQGDQRMLRIAAAVPVVVLFTGVALSAAIGAVMAARSTRARRRAREDALRQQGRASERENHRRFLARLDHELKNPLTAIRATAAAAGTAEPAWATVDDQARRLSVLVRDLRKLSELETRALEHEPVDLEALLREAIGAVVQQHPQAAQRITLDATRVPWPVPPISVDLDLLSLAVDNLLGNAVKYAQSGPIEVRLREDSGWAVIEIADSGRGVPADDLPAVFDELARAGNARDVAGSGLGLTLVSIVASRHGGDVLLRSVEGAGTVATLRLPVRR